MKNKLSVLLILIVICASTDSWGQKVKYKDLFFLIHKSKKYEDGEPFLRSFLSNPKNSNHANANFQMAMIHEFNSKKKDVLTENREKTTLLDSAVYFYSKAKSLVTEKEVKKNSEYYEDDFLRRDLRTGKMGIKMSDVHIDLDKRVEELNIRIGNLKSINLHFHSAERQYQSAFETYSTLTSQFDSHKTLYLRASEEDIKQLDNIVSSYDSAMGNFGEYKLKMAQVVDADYNQTLNALKIDGIHTSKDMKTNFYTSSVDVLDFSEWANGVKNIVLGEIKPIKEKLIAYDQRLDNTRKILFKDSVSIASKITMEKDDALFENLAKYDARAIPLTLLELKIEELLYWSAIFDNEKYKDSTSISYLIEMAANELSAIGGVDSVSNILLGYDISSECKNYTTYINKQYQGEAGLQRYIKQKLDFAQEEKKYRSKILESLNERSRWLMYGNDSIPLFKRDSTDQLINLANTQYVMLGKSNVENTTPFTYGIKYDSTGAGSSYVSSIPDSLSISDIYSDELEDVFQLEQYQYLVVKSVHDTTLKLTYVMYSDSSPFEQKAKKAQLTCVNGVGEVLWSEAIELVYPSDNISLYDKGGVSINYDVKYIDTTNSDKLVSRLLIGTDGKEVN